MNFFTIILLLLFNQSTAQTLVYNFDASSQQLQGWSSSQNLGFTTCNGGTILGGYNQIDMNAKMSNVNKTLIRINQWNSDTLIIEVDGVQQFSESYISASSLKLCGSIYSYEEDTISIDISHSQRSASILIYILQNIANSKSWGIRLLNFFIYECQYSILDQKCCDFIDWILTFSSFTSVVLTSYEGWSSDSPDIRFVNAIYYFHYELYMQQTFPLPTHDQIKISFQGSGIFDLYVDSQLILQTQIDQFNSFIISNIQHTSSTAQITFQGVKICKYIRNFFLYINIGCVRNYQLVQFQRGCSEFQNSQCLNCMEGWQLNYELNLCQTICGDNLISGQEQCDDGNNIPYDGCFQCKFQCNQNCEICIFGQCEKCNDGFFFNINQQCQQRQEQQIIHFLQQEIKLENSNSFCPVEITNYNLMLFEEILNFQILDCLKYCGDGFINGIEQCDDGNTFPYDGCYQCEFQCDINCQLCEFGLCVECLQNFEFDSQSNTCIPICNDNVLIPYTQEQCDDGNLIKGDGCYNCLYECSDFCSFCNYDDTCLQCVKSFKLIHNKCICEDGFIEVNGKCERICEYGYQFVDDKCESICEDGFEYINDQCQAICGDQKVIPNVEDCDDGNFKEYDGCFNCKFSCVEYCEICNKGQCEKCLDQYDWLENNCKPIQQIPDSSNNNTTTDSQLQQQLCGNGVIDSEEEECDDMNDQSNDGCFQCLIEENFICVQISKDQISQCIYVQQANLYATFLNSTNNLQYVQITFSQMVKIESQTNFSDYFKMNIRDIQEDKFKTQLIIESELTDELSQAEYLIIIEFFANLNYKPVLEFSINQQIYNSFNKSISQNDYYVNLEEPRYLDENQKSKAESLYNINKNILMTLGAVSIISLFTGMSELFEEILNILSYQQYLRYINLNYPQNLEIFFSINDMLSCQPIYDFIQLDNYLDKVQYQNQYTDSNGKFKKYSINSDFQSNIQSQLLQVLGILIMILMFRNISKIKLKYFFNSKFFYKMSRLSLTSPKIALLISKKVFDFFTGLEQLQKFLTLEGLKQVFYLNGWDMVFKIFLYLFSSHDYDRRNLIQFSLAISILSIYVYIALDDVNQMKVSAKISAYEQNNLINKQKKRQSLNLLRQLVFLFFLVYFQDDPKLQTTLISMTSLIWSCLTIRYMENARTLFITLVIEGSVSLFTITSLIYLQDFQVFISYEQSILAGWVHICLLSLGMAVQLIMSIYISIKKIFCSGKVVKVEDQPGKKLQIFI